MKLSIVPFLDTRSHARMANALAGWYDDCPGILRLWAIRPTGDTGRTATAPVRVVVMLRASPDGDETRAMWMARAGHWARELQELLARAVQLEYIDDVPTELFEIDGDGAVVASLDWRDPTVMAA